MLSKLGFCDIGTLVRYLVVGSTSFALELALFYAMSAVLDTEGALGVAVSNTVAYSAVFAYNFMLTRRWTFRSEGRIGRQATMHLTLFAVNLIVSNVAVYSASLRLGMDLYVAKAATMCLMVLWNLLIYVKVIYADKGGRPKGRAT
ncbi:MAG: GtrA family protein [Oscillospiraceae bacterium]|nr:GtrA family protein [Oscillospiraceae bacterium]